MNKTLKKIRNNVKLNNTYKGELRNSNIIPIHETNATSIQGDPIMENSDMFMLDESSESISAIEPRGVTEIVDLQTDQFFTDDQLSTFIKKCNDSYKILKLKHEILIGKYKSLYYGIKEILNAIVNLKENFNNIKLIFSLPLIDMVKETCMKFIGNKSLYNSEFILRIKRENEDNKQNTERTKLDPKEINKDQQILNKSEEIKDLLALIDSNKIELVMEKLGATKENLPMNEGEENQ